MSGLKHLQMTVSMKISINQQTTDVSVPCTSNTVSVHMLAYVTKWKNRYVIYVVWLFKNIIYLMMPSR